MRLSKREIILLYLLVMLLAVFLAVTFLINPMIEDIGNLNAQSEQLRQELRQNQAGIELGKKQIEEIEALKKQLAEHREKLLDFQGDTHLYTFTQQFFADRDFKILSYSTQTTMISEEDSETCFVVVTVRSEHAESESKDAARAACEVIFDDLYGYYKSTILNAASYTIDESAKFKCTLNVNFSIYMNYKG